MCIIPQLRNYCETYCHSVKPSVSNKHNSTFLHFFVCFSVYRILLIVNLIIHCQLLSPQCRTLGLVHQSENFIYNRYNSYAMDSWSYLESPVLEQTAPKPRLQPGEDLTALTLLYEQCKVGHVGLNNHPK